MNVNKSASFSEVALRGLTFKWGMTLSYRNQSIDWFLYEKDIDRSVIVVMQGLQKSLADVDKITLLKILIYTA